MRIRGCLRQASNYRDTLNLPKSALANRSDRSRMTELVTKTGQDLYRWQADARKDQPACILHDGPPYANGDLHLGHALNKIIKDLINRFKVQVGERVNYIPGWDCHGLPIEHASLKRRAAAKKPAPETITERRDLARDLALEMIAKQKEQFRGFAVMADWDSDAGVYKTLSPDYVVRQLRVFARLLDKGLIFRQNRPVFWSPDSQTALAEG